MKRLLMAVLGLLTDMQLLAGTWTSGGGQLIKDAQNPWWVQNTKTVQYCILDDAQNFHIPGDLGGMERSEYLNDLVSSALSRWQEEFAYIQKREKDWMVGTQEFIKAPRCDASNVTLRFQFGTLSPGQLIELSKMGIEPREHVSMAIRTDYDRVNLRGQGFIYLAPSSGPLKPSDERLLENPWGRGKGGVIELILLHELGHIFGMPHENGLGRIMAADLPEKAMTNETYSDIYKDRDHFVPQLRARDDLFRGWIVNGGAPKENTEFFGASPDSLVQLERTGPDDNTIPVVEKVYRDGSIQTVKQLGHIHITNRMEESSVQANALAPKLFLPKEQTVIQYQGDLIYLRGPLPMTLEVRGYFQPDGSTEKRDIHALILPTRGRSITGVKNGKIVVLDRM